MKLYNGVIVNSIEAIIKQKELTFFACGHIENKPAALI